MENDPKLTQDSAAPPDAPALPVPAEPAKPAAPVGAAPPPSRLECDRLDWLENQAPLTPRARARDALMWLITTAVALSLCALLFLALRHLYRRL